MRRAAISAWNRQFRRGDIPGIKTVPGREIKYIDEGKFSNIRKLAKAVGLDESVVGATLRLRWLAPGVVHDILNGGCKDVSLKQLRHGVPELWKEQEEMLMGKEADLTQE